MKTVLFMIPSLGGGGAERVLVNLVNNMDKTKYSVTVQTLFDVGVNRQYLNPDINYIPGWKYQFPGNTKIMKIMSPRMLYRMIVKKHYDIVISYLEGPTARVVSGCPYSSTKLISWIHVEQHNIRRAAYSFRSCKEAISCYGKFDKIVCVAQSVKKDFESIFPMLNECEVLYNTNEYEKILQLSREKVEDVRFSDKCNVISMGRLVPEKGYDRLIEAHVKLLQQGLLHHIYVLGTGKCERELRGLVEQCHVEETFHFLGFKENPYKYIAKADIFVCSSRREGFSTAVTEALILGVPTLSTLCSGAIELLGEHNEWGIVTENTTEGIYQGLENVLINSDLLDKYRTQAADRGQNFSTMYTVSKVENMLSTLFASN